MLRRAQPLHKLTSLGGLDGSIMFWVFLLAVFGSIAVYVNRDRHRELIPHVVATISIVQMFFIFLMVIHNNPFETFLADALGTAAASARCSRISTWRSIRHRCMSASSA